VLPGEPQDGRLDALPDEPLGGLPDEPQDALPDVRPERNSGSESGWPGWLPSLRSAG